MMKQQLSMFESSQFGSIRTATTESGEALFCLVDVCKALGLQQSTRLKQRLLQKGVHTIHLLTNGGTQQAYFITEPNLYRCIFQSRKPNAEQFQDWVYSEVLPSIRKQGGYIAARQDESPEQLMARALTIANQTLTRQAEQLTMSQRREVLLQSQCKVLAEQNDRAEQELEASKPARVFAQAVETSRQSILIGELAVILKQNGIDIGQNRLFDWMRKNGYLFRWGDRYNQPTQRSMELQLFEVKKTTITRPNGEVLVTSTTKVTGKGQVYFVNKFLFEAEKHAGKGRKKSARPYGAAPEPRKPKTQEAVKPQDPANVADAAHPKASVGAETSES